MTYRLPTKKQAERFHKLASERLLRLGFKPTPDGLREFSLHPATLLELRKAIRDSDLSDLQSRAAKLLQARDRAGIERWLKAATSI